MNRIDLGRALKAFFNDKNWAMKTLLGFVWGLLGVTAPAVTGAQLEYIRRVSRGNEELPEWDDFGQKWVAGFMVALAGMIYFLPIIVLLMIFMVPAILAGIGGGNSDAFGAILGGGMCLFWLVAIVYGVAVSLLFAAAITNYAMKQTFGAMFAFGDIMALVKGGTGYFTAWLYVLVVGFIGGAVTSVLSATGIGTILYPAVTYFVTMASGHILGQWAIAAYGTAPAAATMTAPPGYTPPAMTPPAPPAPPAAEPVAPVAPPAQPAYEPPAPPAAPAYEPPAAPAVPETPPMAPPAPPAPPSEPAAPPSEPPAGPDEA
jgi:hypothetical protein